MNILFSFCNVINPHRGGTERVVHMISTFLEEQGNTIYYLCTEKQSSAYTPPPNTIFLPKLESIEEKAEYVKSLCLCKAIDVVINEGGVTDDIYFLSKESLPCSVKVITCMHFDITADLKSFYSNYNYSFSCLSFAQCIKKVLQIIRLPYLKHYHTRRRVERYRYAALHSDKVIVLSPACVQNYLNFTGVPDDGKVIHIPNPNSFEEPDDISLLEKENIILFVGRVIFSPKKVHRILEFWRELHAAHADWKLQIVGEGDDLPRCKKLAAKWHLPRVEFVGATNNVQQYYRKARILVLTSDYEGTPMVVPEAQAYGCVPVVYHSYAGASLHIKDGENGYLIPAFDKSAFIKQLSTLMQASPLTIENVQQELYRFSEEKIGAIWSDLLNKMKD